MKTAIAAIAVAIMLSSCATRVYESHDTETVPVPSTTVVSPEPDVIVY